jgi:AcrR family transcriptional regulator
MEISSKQQEILKAARECFARFGYEKTTLDDIGKMVGINKASLYYYYKNKEAIYREVVLDEFNDSMKILRTKIEEIPGCRDRILTYIRKKIQYIQQLTNVHKLSMDACRNRHPLAHPHLLNQIKEKENDFINGILLSSVKHGEMKDCDTKRVAQTILTVMDAIKTKAFQGIDARFVDKVDMTALEDEVAFAVSLILDGLMIKKE